MEKKLSIRLLDRSARQLRFTNEGEFLCLRGTELVEQFDILLATCMSDAVASLAS
jgi:DNA-binding transcriptional LysR family regulator